MSDLLYSVGVDQTPLNVGVDAIEARLEESGIRMAEAPSKYAKASADAFKEVFTAEDKLAQFREESNFRRLTDEEKLSVLRTKALGILDQIQSIDGQSLEKVNLQVEFEKNKNAIYELQQKLVAETAAGTREQTEEIAKQPGLLGKIGQVTEDIKKTLKDMGVSLKGIGLGILIGEVVTLGREAIANAQKTRDEFLTVGKSVDTATRSMAALGDGIDGVKSLAVKSVGFLISGYTQLGDVAGSLINRMRGISEAQENIAAAAQRDADAAAERLKKLELEQHNVQTIATARKAAADAATKQAREALEDVDKINVLLMESIKIREQIKHTEEGTVAWFERQKDLSEKLNDIHALDLKLTKERDAIETKNATALDEASIKAAAAALEYNTITARRAATLEQIKQLQSGITYGLKENYDVSDKINRLAELRIGLLKEEQEQERKRRLSNEGELELFRLKQQAVTQEDRARLDVLLLQKKARTDQVEIDDLLEKGVKNLTSHETTRLGALIAQLDEIGKQISAGDALLAGIKAKTAAEESYSAVLDREVQQLRDAYNWANARVNVERTGSTYENQSTTALEGVAERLRRQLAEAQLNPSTDPLVQAIQTGPLQAELNNAQAELNRRRAVKDLVERKGEDVAIRTYGDDAVNRALQDLRDVQTRTAATLERIAKGLGSTGIIPIG